MALALDEPTQDDSSFEQEGFTFCIAKELLEKIQSVSIDLTYMGFTVEPGIPLSSGGSSSSCGGCSGSSSCSG